MAERKQAASPKAKPAGDFPEGLSAPAHRALAGAGITRLAQLAKWREADLLKLHGLGPKGIRTLKAALQARGLTFKAG